MRKLYAILVLIALALVLSGCSGQNESPAATTTPTESVQEEQQEQQEGGNPYYTTSEAPLSGDAKELDEMIRPILNDIFGGAKAESFLSGSSDSGMGVSILYVLKRPVENSDLESLKTAISNLGFSTNYGGVNGQDFGYAFTKDQTALLIGGTIGEQRIQVTLGTG